MARKLAYTDAALADLVAIRGWLTQSGSGATARKRLKAIGAAISRLRDDPCLHPIGPHPGIRELPCEGGYRAFYVVDPDTGKSSTAGDVGVLRVYGPGQARGPAAGIK